MRYALTITGILLIAACSREAGVSPSETTTILISGPEKTVAKATFDVERFEVTPDTLGAGGKATVNVALSAPPKNQDVSVNWHGPDGWLEGYAAVDPGKPQDVITVPASEFNESGTYRIVLRSGARNLAEETIQVTR